MRKIKFIVTLELEERTNSIEQIMDDLHDRIVDSYNDVNIVDTVSGVGIEDYRRHKSNLLSNLYSSSTYINGTLNPLYKFQQVVKKVIKKL